jgi:hypothetical protein
MHSEDNTFLLLFMKLISLKYKIFFLLLFALSISKDNATITNRVWRFLGPAGNGQHQKIHQKKEVLV